MAVFFPEKEVFLTHFMDLQDLRILRGPKMENRSPPGPKLCYLFQAGIPKIGLLGQINGVLTSFGGQNSVPPEGKSVLGTPNLAILAKSEAPDLGSGPPRPSIGGLRPQIWPPRDPILDQNWPIQAILAYGDPHFDLWEVKMTPNLSSGRSKIDHFTQFSSFL